LIAKLKDSGSTQVPLTDLSELKTESDVEQKLVYPFLSHPSFLGIPHEWIRTKEYMEPTEVDKRAGRRAGYIPDYSVWRTGFPLIVVEAKRPDVAVETALQEAQMYAARINARYPPNINPIGWVLASNGERFALAQADSQTDVLYALASDLRPGSDILAAFKGALNRDAFDARARDLNIAFQSRRFTRTAQFFTGSQFTEQLGINPFAQHLFPIITRYFGQEADEAPDDIIDRCYVSTDERSEYGAVLEVFLKDRARVLSDKSFQKIDGASKADAEGLISEVRKHGNIHKNPGRVQLIVGAVGSGKSLFIRRFFKRVLPEEMKKKTMWAFINFNTELKDAEEIRRAVAEGFIESLGGLNDIDLDDFSVQEKLFRPELTSFDKGPARLLKDSDPQKYNHEKYFRIKALVEDKEKVAEAISRHYTGERGITIVVVFDNVDKRSRDVQLAIFEAAQWFKELTRALVIVNMRDTTFEAHRDEPPLDAFINAVNFYIKSPRFGAMVRRRLDVVVEAINSDPELKKVQKFTIEGGVTVTYDSERLGSFLMSIQEALFDRRTGSIGAALESLSARNARSALGMFADIIASPHIPTNQIGSTATSSAGRIDEEKIIRALMCGRYRLFNNRLRYIRNILSPAPVMVRPSNFLYADILEFLIRNRKEKIDYSIEGYASGWTIVNRMQQLGYDEEDAFKAVKKLAEWNLIEPESLLVDAISLDDAMKVHASGFIHMRYFLRKPEYLIRVSTDLSFASYDLAKEIGHAWTSGGEPGFRARQRLLDRLATYFGAEYDRRVRRHAFYEDLGSGGKAVALNTRRIASEYGQTRLPGTSKRS
jgi:GTPase SAR1 family protein